MAQELEQLKRTRSAARGWLTRTIRALEAVMAAEIVDRVDLEDAVHEFDIRFGAVDEAQTAVEYKLPDADLEADLDEAAQSRGEARVVRRKATRLLLSLRTVTASGTEESSENGSVTGSEALKTVKLPRLELPKFSGNLTLWQSFWDQFKAIVDASDLPKVSKFTYLQSLLTGEAKTAIEGLALTSDHYDTACELLEQRFGKPERIIFAHIQSLLTLSIGPGKGTPTDKLRRLQDELLGHVRSLEALGIKGEKYGILLTPVVLSRLPADIRMEWAREGEGKESDLTWLLAFLKKEIERRERAECFKEVTSKHSDRVNVQEEKKGTRVPTTSALQTSSQNAWSCEFCGKSHATARCIEVLKLPIPEREKRIKEKWLCFRCLKSGHIAKGCSAKCAKCTGRHHEMCCTAGQKTDSKTLKAEDTQVKSAQDVPVEATNVSHVGVSCSKKLGGYRTVLQTARVCVHGSKGKVEATLLFDSGSDRTYVSSSLINRVGPKWVSSIDIKYAAFGGGKSTSKMRNVYELHTEGVHGVNRGREAFTAVEVPVICAPLRRPKVPVACLKALGDLQLADNYCEERELSIDILVGLDYYWQLVRQGIVHVPNGPVAQDTAFGWVVSGSWDSNSSAVESHQLLSLEDIPERNLRSFWDLESIGINPLESCVDNSTLKHFNETIQFKDGRYEVALPWKQGPYVPELMDNERTARARLSSLSRRLNRDPNLRSSYDQVLEEMERQGMITEVNTGELVPYPVFYLPHHPVVKETSTTTKVRPVFDASAVGPNDVSLNDCLETGPSLIPNLVEVLIRFRRWKVALTADIRKAFLQISLRREDQDVHRFLWEHHGSVRVMRFERVTFGNKSSPFLLNATVRYHLSLFSSTRVIEELMKNLYVDDWLSGADTEAEAHKMLSEAKEVMQKAGMELTKWNSNSKEVSGKVYTHIGGKHLESESFKILGVKWTSDEDVFSFDGIEIPTGITTTKRVVLSFIARLFDPLGFLAPFIMIAKCLFQELWQLGLHWDDEVPEELHAQFCHWLEGINVLKQWQIPRCYMVHSWSSLEGVELHAFGDASVKGYGAVVYLRVPSSDGKFATAMVVSKAKVAPLQKVTLPRLELLGSLLAARLLKFVCQTLELPKGVVYRCWTDSMVVLAWVKGSPGRWKQFVANRVSEIQGLTDPAQWFHCPGKDNPADLTTRGLYAENLVTSTLWLHGPSWLNGPTDLFPGGEPLVDEMPAEEKVTIVTVTSELYCRPLLKVERWSTLTKALNVTGWILRFIHNVRHGGERRTGGLSHREQYKARVQFLCLVQLSAFPGEIDNLKQGKALPKGSPVAKLNPFIGSDGLMRVKGRLQMSELSYEDKHPIILQSNHAALLLVRFQHKLLKHAGVGTLVTSLRDGYWIIGLRRLAKQVKRECVFCQKQDARACSEPAGPLPELRVTQSPPFTVTGIDFAGPLFCRDHPKDKFYVCLFTCAVIRAVHLELVDSLSLLEFMMALRRFAARRGLPSVLYSDNATTFKGAERQLRAYFGPHSPEWKFIVPKSPWWGGWWERLIRSVKGALKKSLGTSCLSRAELETTLHEVEACINSRPLTFVGDEPDCRNPLSPSHFLIGKRVGFQPKVLEDQGTVNRQNLLLRDRIRLEQLDKFWSIWRDDYLRNLPPSVKGWKAQGGLKIGSVVLIREDNVPRMRWDLGVVTELFPGKDGVCRSVSLHTNKGPRTRAIQRLHDLEIVHQTTDGLCSPQGVMKCEVEHPPEIKERTLKPKVIAEQVKTRAGRIVKPVQRLGNNIAN